MDHFKWVNRQKKKAEMIQNRKDLEKVQAVRSRFLPEERLTWQDLLLEKMKEGADLRKTFPWARIEHNTHDQTIIITADFDLGAEVNPNQLRKYRD